MGSFRVQPKKKLHIETMRDRKNGNFQTNNNEISGERNAGDRLNITINIQHIGVFG